MNNIIKLCEILGLSSSFIDKMGDLHNTSFNVRKKFLQSIGINDFSSKNINSLIHKLEHQIFVNKCKNVVSFFKSDIKEFDIYIPFDYMENTLNYTCFKDGLKLFSHKIFIKKDMQTEYIIVDNIKIAHIKIILKMPKEFGYYDLSFSIKDLVFSSFIIYSPDTAYLPDCIEKKKEKLLGIAIQLYAISSSNNMGVGDFSDLKNIMKLASENNIDFVGINPLGVMYYQSKDDVSPYRVFSREFINYLYIDLKKVYEFKFINIPISIQKKINTLKICDKVDYFNILTIKLSLLFKMYNVFIKNKNSNRFIKFQNFKKDKGENLYNLCLFETLIEKNNPDWQKWQKDFKNLKSKKILNFANENKKRIDFYAYCHWIAETQLKNVYDFAKKLNMKVGLYLDMPVGAASNGVEVWQNQELFAKNMDIGTPPDTIRPKGQTWGLVPMIPYKLIENKYKFIINLFRKNMLYAGAIRIDHALGLMRLFWVNDDNKGAYVYYDFKTMIAILSIESHLNKCLIIGEDLGNVPDGFREILASHHILSNKILFRQKDHDGEFLSTKKYPYLSLSQVSTHDQATSCGFWVGEDIHTNFKCKLFPKISQYNDNLKLRQNERIAFYKALNKSNCFYNNKQHIMKFIDGAVPPYNIEYSFNMYGAKTNSALFIIRIEDMVRQIAMENVPGTIYQYPNWKIKLPRDIKLILKKNSHFIRKILYYRNMK